jgi:hypothetical protein
MNCPYREHHSSGGGWGGPIAAILAAMVAAAVLGPVFHIIEIALAIAGLVLVGGTVGLVLLRVHRGLSGVPRSLPVWQRVAHLQPQPRRQVAAGTAAARGRPGRRPAPAPGRSQPGRARRGDATAAQRPVVRAADEPAARLARPITVPIAGSPWPVGWETGATGSPGHADGDTEPRAAHTASTLIRPANV